MRGATSADPATSSAPFTVMVAPTSAVGVSETDITSGPTMAVYSRCSGSNAGESSPEEIAKVWTYAAGIETGPDRAVTAPEALVP